MPPLCGHPQYSRQRCSRDAYCCYAIQPKQIDILQRIIPNVAIEIPALRLGSTPIVEWLIRAGKPPQRAAVVSGAEIIQARFLISLLGGSPGIDYFVGRTFIGGASQSIQVGFTGRAVMLTFKEGSISTLGLVGASVGFPEI